MSTYDLFDVEAARRVCIKRALRRAGVEVPREINENALLALAAAHGVQPLSQEEVAVTAGWATPTDLSVPFPVLMRCGHVEMRRMKPSTARATASPDGEIRSANLCAACFAQHNESAITRYSAAGKL